MDLLKSLNSPSVVARASQTHATATASLANPTQSSPSPGVNLRWYIDGFAFSIGGGPVTTAATLQIKDGATVLHEVQIPVTAATVPLMPPLNVVLTHPWRCTPGNAATAVVTDMGASIIADVTLWGHVDD
jgi:hypothetical protein